VTELLTMEFFRNALFMSIFLGILFGVISFFIVIRNMSFLGAGLAHMAFGGVALGVLTGINPFYTALVFCMLAVILMRRISKKGSISYDAGIGIFFSFSMALGAIFIALSRNYTFDLSGYLFGNILGISKTDFWFVLTTSVFFLPFFAICFHKILFMSFEEDVAVVNGINTSLLDVFVLIFLAMIIVVSIKIVGIILVTALVVLPGSFGMLLSNNYRVVIISGIVYIVLIMTGGLFLSYQLDLPAGATMVTLGTIVYFLIFLILNLFHSD